MLYSHNSSPPATDLMSIEITVFPGGQTLTCPSGVRLHEALARVGGSLTTPCGGNGTCGKCAVRVAPGQALHGKQTITSEVLACQHVVREPLTVWLSEESRPSDVTQILTSHLALNDLSFNYQSRTVDAEEKEKEYVIAVDLGTTTLVAELICRFTQRSCGVQSCRNPQAGFGDDVISRIQYASESPENAVRFRMAVVDAINDLISSLARDEPVSPGEITQIAIAGNTTMQQLFAGLDVRSLGHSPFEPAVMNYPPTRAADYGVAIHTEGLAQLFPVIGGFVGGDLVAGIIATSLCSLDAPSLLIDIGTNGEIILWRPDGLLLAAATAAGPAFEGARISQGMIAAPGAIERVAVGDDLRVETIGNQPARGICGSGLIDLVAELVRIDAITSAGKLLTGRQLPESVPDAIHDRFVRVDSKPAFVVVQQNESGIGRPILLTQHDIRQVQLAAGAIRAGVTLLLRKAGMQPGDLANVFLAGGFGNYIRRENAQRIGLLPPEIPTARIHFCGNTSLAGAKAVLLSTACCNAMQQVADKAECVDLSKFPDFSTVFAESMFFPQP